MESCQRLCHFLVGIREQCLPADRSKSGARPFSFVERKDFFRPAIVYDRVRQGCSNYDSTRPLQIVVNAIKSVDVNDCVLVVVPPRFVTLSGPVVAPASAHRRRRERAVFITARDHLWRRPFYFGSKVVSSIDSETFCPRSRPAL